VAIIGQVLVPLVLKVTAKTGVMVLVDGKMGNVFQKAQDLPTEQATLNRN